MNYYLTRDKEYKIHNAEEPPTQNEHGNFYGPYVCLGSGGFFQEVFPSEYHLNPGEVAKLDLSKIGFKLIEDTVKTAEETYLYWHKRSGIHKGDTARVARAAAGYEGGWGKGWNTSKSAAVGRSLRIMSDDGAGGFLLEDDWHYPYFVLEKIWPLDA